MRAREKEGFVIARIVAALAALPILAGPADAQRAEIMEAVKKGGGQCPVSKIQRDLPPIYPAASVRAKEEGHVLLGLCLAPDGYAESFEMLSSPNISRLEVATALWACGKRYEPSHDASGALARNCAAVAELDWRLKSYQLPPFREPVDALPIVEPWSRPAPAALR
jgi:hypothetical protein